MIASDWQLPECWFTRSLAWLLSLRASCTKVTGAAEPRRILLIHLGGLGALITASPALAAIRQRFPSAEIALLTCRPLETLYAENGLYNTSIVWHNNGWLTLFGNLLAFRAACRRSPFDLAINLDGLSATARLLTLASAAPTTLGFLPANIRRPPYSRYVSLTATKGAAQAYEAMVSCLGATAPRSLVAPRLRSSEEEEARAWLDSAEARNKAWVGINMNAGDFALYRAWPPEKFAILAQMLADRFGCRLLFTGVANEETYVSRHIKHLNASLLNLAGRTSVRQLAAVLKLLRLFISVDSGPLHLAAALGVPVVGIFGPESPKRFAPLVNGPAAMLWQEPACGPCLSAFTVERRRCLAGAACVRTLPVATVFATASDLLASLPRQE